VIGATSFWIGHRQSSDIVPLADVTSSGLEGERRFVAEGKSTDVGAVADP
jgi:hypothetical protein